MEAHSPHYSHCPGGAAPRDTACSGLGSGSPRGSGLGQPAAGTLARPGIAQDDVIPGTEGRRESPVSSLKPRPRHERSQSTSQAQMLSV